MSWHEEEMIREMPVVNLTLDESVKILVQLKSFNVCLYKDILHAGEESNVELALKADLGMVVLNKRIYEEIYSKIEDIISESNYNIYLQLISITERMYEATVDHLYHEAKKEFENEE